MIARQYVGVLIAVLLSSVCLEAFAREEPLVFNTTVPTNDLQGSLAAQVLFAQSQVIPAIPREGDQQPHLIGRRKCLVMVRLLQPDDVTPVQIAAVAKNGKKLGILDLDPPEKLPKTAYFLDGLPEGPIRFQPEPGMVKVISGRNELEKLGNAPGSFLHEQLRISPLVEIRTADGQWVRDIHLPAGTDLDGKMVRIQSKAGYQSHVHYSGREAALSRGQTLQFKAVGPQWVMEGEVENQCLMYSDGTWSGVLPAEWIVAGVNLWFRQGDRRGRLPALKVGAPTQLLLHTIDLGMLVPPRDRFVFAKDSTAQREYFQTVPVSRMIVSQYAPVFFRRVMLPDGTFLTEQDPGRGDWHNGTMRQRIGKELISHGIDNANYGINSTAGEGEGGHPYIVAQLAAHCSVGRYSNGIVTHGGSGGGGIVTLDSTLGNEFSHEVGHNYGLGHYVGGFAGSVHRSADQNNSTWGWDADRNRFLPNFSPTVSGKDTCLQGACQLPFSGRSFGLDAMAGGAPFSAWNRFTMYTPNSATIIQAFLESKAVFDADSPTGFRKWDAETGSMKPYRHMIDSSERISASVSDLAGDRLAALFAEFDLVEVTMRDGKWTKEVQLPDAVPANRGRTIAIDQAATYDSFLLLNGQRLKMSRGFKGRYTSDGRRWRPAAAAPQQAERKPEAFGVPVTTLVGYYDPQGELTSYIYPALHGAYGFTYSDDPGREGTCHLLVETRQGTRKFRLAGHRINTKVMNKFHVNVATSSQPSSVSIVCRGKVVDKQPIAGPTKELVSAVFGE